MTNASVVNAIRDLEKEGRLSPADVVNEAANPDSPLHHHFDWDDSEAAKKYRLSQARTLIRSVKIEVSVRSVSMSVVGYVRDPDLGGQQSGYRSVARLRSEEDSARLVVLDEMKRVSDAVKRAKALAAVLGFAEQIEEIERIARSVTERITLSEATPATPAQ